MEPAGRVHCLPLHHRHRSGGDPGPGVPHQPHHHPRDAGPQDRQGPQAAQDGQGYPGSAGHGHAGIAAGRLSSLIMKNILLHSCIQDVQKNCSHLVICSFVGFYSCKLQKFGRF